MGRTKKITTTGTAESDSSAQDDALIASLKTVIEGLQKEADEIVADYSKVQGELTREREKNMRLHTRLDELERLMSLRTSALCALLKLPDPRWQPSKEDMGLE